MCCAQCRIMVKLRLNETSSMSDIERTESQKLVLKHCFATSEEVETHGITKVRTARLILSGGRQLIQGEQHLNGTSWQHLIL